MLTKKLLIYALILCGFVFTLNSVASPITNKFSQETPQKDTKELSLQISSVAEISRDVVTTGSANNLVISNDGQVGFFSEVKGGYVYAYDLNTGEQLSKILTGKKATGLSLFDNGEKRLLAVTNLSDPSKNEPIIVSLLDVSNAKKINLVSAFILPLSATLNRVFSLVFDSSGMHIFIASQTLASLFVFETSSGRMLEQIPLTGGISSLKIAHKENNSLIAATSLEENKVTIFEFSSNFKLQQKATFKLSETDTLIAQNNLCFNNDASIAYIASAKSNKLFSFETLTGSLIDSYEVGDTPAQIALTQVGAKTKLAVVNTGKNHGFLANSVSLIEATSEGRFKGATVFLPPLGANLVADSRVSFSDRGELGFVGTRNQSLFVFDSLTGEQLTETKLLGSATKFVLSKNRVVALTSDITSKRLVVVNKQIDKNLSENSTPITTINKTPRFKTKTIKAKPISDVINISQVKLVRQRQTIKIRLLGKGFEPNSQIVVNERPIKTTYLRANKLGAKFPIKLLLGRCTFDVVVKNARELNSPIFKGDLKCGK